MGEHHRGCGDGGGSPEVTEVDDADAGDAASGKGLSRECRAQMGILFNVLWVDSLRPLLGVDAPHVGTTSRYSVVSTPCTVPEPAASTRRPGTPSSRESSPRGPTNPRAPNGPNESLGQVIPFSQGEFGSLSNPIWVYSVRPIHTSSITLSCTSGFSVAALVPENPMLLSRSAVRITSRPKLTSPLPRVDARRSRFVLVLLLE